VTSGAQEQTGVCYVTVNACSTTAPAANTTFCTDGPAPDTNNKAGTLAAACIDTVQCDWVCAAGYFKDGNICTAYVCQ